MIEEAKLAPLYLMIDTLIVCQRVQLANNSHELNYYSFATKILNKPSTSNVLNNSIEQLQLSRKDHLKSVEAHNLWWGMVKG